MTENFPKKSESFLSAEQSPVVDEGGWGGRRALSVPPRVNVSPRVGAFHGPSTPDETARTGPRHLRTGVDLVSTEDRTKTQCLVVPRLHL